MEKIFVTDIEIHKLYSIVESSNIIQIKVRYGQYLMLTKKDK